MPKRPRGLKGDMNKRSGVLNWISGTLLWLDKRDSLENIKLWIGGKRIIMK